MTTLTNSFHNSTARTRATLEELEEIERTAGNRPDKLTSEEKALVRRIRNKLCGINGCICGDFWGCRK